jgi:hypothetical protein
MGAMGTAANAILPLKPAVTNPAMGEEAQVLKEITISRSLTVPNCQSKIEGAGIPRTLKKRVASATQGLTLAALRRAKQPRQRVKLALEAPEIPAPAQGKTQARL